MDLKTELLIVAKPKGFEFEYWLYIFFKKTRALKQGAVSQVWQIKLPLPPCSSPHHRNHQAECLRPTVVCLKIP